MPVLNVMPLQKKRLDQKLEDRVLIDGLVGIKPICHVNLRSRVRILRTQVNSGQALQPTCYPGVQEADTGDPKSKLARETT